MPVVAAALVVLGIVGLPAAVAVDQSPVSAGAAPLDPCAISTTSRVVAVGDIHGAYDAFVTILGAAGLVDEENRWSGGRAILVQLGDVLDRGSESRRALDLLWRLEQQAPDDGGLVIPMLGNHEVMRMQRDLRYVSPDEYEAFRSTRTEAIRDVYYKLLLDEARESAEADGEPFSEPEFREWFLERVPLGYVEMQAAFEATGDYGQWLRRHPAMVRINDVVYVHGGISPEVAALGCAAVNQTVREELANLLGPDDPRNRDTLSVGPDGPLWYRGLADDLGLADEATVDEVFARLGARMIVVGHTPTEDGEVHTRFDDRVVQVDTGMLGGDPYPGGGPAALEIDGTTMTAIYPDRREVLVSGPAASTR